MEERKINSLLQSKSVLVAPLDWGLGHATRCIPVIKALKKNGWNVIIGATGATRLLLQHELQELTFVDPPSYNIRYTKRANLLPIKLLLQLPGILRTIQREHSWLKKIKKNFSLTAVIADNRFGLYDKQLTCVYMTHQLQVQTGRPIFDRVLQKIHYGIIKKFSFCWVPDYKDEPNLAGALSHPSTVPVNTKYIGALTRFEKAKTSDKSIDLLILLSGPEPQRTIFEKKILQQLKNATGKVLLLRGLPGAENLSSPNNNVCIINHADAATLSRYIQQSEWVICRSGYTTVMDLLQLQQKAILVPTPGQTEQEYLAAHLYKQQLFFTASQDDFDLSSTLQQAKQFNFIHQQFNMELYQQAVAELTEWCSDK